MTREKIKKKFINSILLKLDDYSLIFSSEILEETDHLSHTLGMDSLDIAECLILTERKFNITFLESDNIETIKDIIDIVYQRQNEKTTFTSFVTSISNFFSRS